MTANDTEEVLYEGTLFYGEHNKTAAYNLRLKKGPVCLKCSSVCHGDGGEVQKLYTLSTGKTAYRFKAENLFFFEREDIEYPIKGTDLADCWRRRPRRRRFTPFSVISLVFLNDRPRQITSLSLQQNQRESILIEHEQKIQSLVLRLEHEFGSVISYFVGSRDGTRFDLRLAVTKHNFSLLDSKLKNIEYFQFKALRRVGVSFNQWTQLLVIAIQEPYGTSQNITEFVTIRTIEVKTENGECIRDLLSKHVGIYAMPHLCNEPQEHTAESSIARVETWIKDLHRRSVEEGNLSFPSSPFHSFSDPLKPELSSLDLENNNSDPSLIPESPPDLPLPSPCTNQSSTFTPPIVLPKPCRRSPVFSSDDFKDLPKLPRKALPRCHSIGDELNRDLSTHLYVNSVRDSHCQDDHIYYYRFYQNQGHVKVKRSKMKFKMQRRSRLSDDLGDINFEAVGYHEKYVEEIFHSRSDDPKYQRLTKRGIYSYVCHTDVPSRFNIPPEAEVQKQDDPYWESNLCLFIQSMFQLRKPPNIYHQFDLTQGQYARLAVCLDVITHSSVRRKDWTDFAAWIGITSAQDIELIQHFCYTYKYLAMDLVLGYWCFQYRRGCNVPPCTYDQLRNIIIHIERDDILRILTHTDTNPEEDEFSDEDNETHL